MFKILKNFIKRKFLILKIRNRFFASVQIEQRKLYLKYQELAKNNQLPKLSETGFRVFSQFEEDGKLLFIFSVLGMPQKTFVEIGSDDGINSNSANLYFHFGWYGLFIDANNESIKRGKDFFSKYPHSWFYPPKFAHAKVTSENINQIIENKGFKGEIGLLSIDIDGNDYWIWNAIEIIEPQVVIIETHIEFGYNSIVVPYNPEYQFPGKHPIYHGASPVAMTKLAKKKGYRLVGANELGFNFIFIKNGLAEKQIPEVSIESVLTHISVLESFKEFEKIKNWDFIHV